MCWRLHLDRDAPNAFRTWVGFPPPSTRRAASMPSAMRLFSGILLRVSPRTDLQAWVGINLRRSPGASWCNAGACKTPAFSGVETQRASSGECPKPNRLDAEQPHGCATVLAQNMDTPVGMLKHWRQLTGLNAQPNSRTKTAHHRWSWPTVWKSMPVVLTSLRAWCTDASASPCTRDILRSVDSRRMHALAPV